MTNPDLSSRIDSSLRFYNWLGWGVTVLALGGFLLWAIVAPLDQGVTAEGVVRVAGNSKTVQSFITGKIDRIAVKEGEHVDVDQLLVSLDSTQAQAQVTALTEHFVTASAVAARLQAEYSNLPQPHFSDELKALISANTGLSPVLSLQETLLEARRNALQQETGAYRKTIDGFNAQLNGLEMAITSRKNQLNSLGEQLKNMAQLAKEGYLPRHRYLEIGREYQNLQGLQQQDQGRAGQIRNQVLETEQNIARREAEYQKEVRSQLSQAQMELAEYRRQLSAATAELKNTDIRAPLPGAIVGLKVFTTGGVVTLGEALMDIVPSTRELEVEVQLPVNLIDKVSPGLDVDLLFIAFNQNRAPIIKGKVVLISADRLTDPKTGAVYYSMKVTVPGDELRKLKDNRIVPGMPVSAFIRTGERSLFSYLFKPLVDRAHMSMTEE